MKKGVSVGVDEEGGGGREDADGKDVDVREREDVSDGSREMMEIVLAMKTPCQ